MIILTAAALGVSAGQMRSAGVIALVAALIGMTFALAAITSPGPVSIVAFVYAVLGYNGGLMASRSSLTTSGPSTETTSSCPSFSNSQR